MPPFVHKLLGKAVDSAEVLQAIRQLGLDDTEEDPPFRRYIGSKKTGLDLLVEQGQVIAVQVFVKAVQGFAAFPNELPYGLHRNMKRDEVHRLLGSPNASDEFDICYKNIETDIDITINFDKLSEITYLNIRAKAFSLNA